jgi:NADPH:quinone reductase-like Zn-dependent oxidoreductase
MSRLEGLDFLVDKSAWQKTRFVERELSTDLAPGQVLFRVDRFAFTANNVTYALAGDMLHYWDFFPQTDGWGCLPTMGYGDVVASAHDGVAVGTRCSGFFPMGRTLLIEPSSASRDSIVDGVAHRQQTAPAYRQYRPVAHDGLYTAEHEDELALVRGLFMTSFLAEDFLFDSDLYGASSIVISSASSKTSIALAFVVAERGRARPVGLTSARNLDFVKSLGLYDQVLTYDEIGALPGVPSVFVDMAGDLKVTRGVHEHLGTNLKFSQGIGATHWDAGGDDADLPGPTREFFFAPAQIGKRITDWGARGFEERLGASLRAFIEGSAAWMRVDRAYGREAVERVYRATLTGSARPETGHVLSLWDDEDAAAGR